MQPLKTLGEDFAFGNSGELPTIVVIGLMMVMTRMMTISKTAMKPTVTEAKKKNRKIEVKRNWLQQRRRRRIGRSKSRDIGGIQPSISFRMFDFPQFDDRFNEWVSNLDTLKGIWTNLLSLDLHHFHELLQLKEVL